MEQHTTIIETEEVTPPKYREPNGNGGPTARSGGSEAMEWIRKAAHVCREAANGNLEARILGYTRNDELGSMIHSINNMLDVTDAYVRESRASLEYAAKGKFFRRVLLRGLPGSFKAAAAVINSGTEEMKSSSRCEVL
jgi:methyl-accepting chemotaxis protein